MNREEHNKDYRVTLEVLGDLWAKTYNTDGNPDWSHILPYYHKDIYFRDSIQEIRGIQEFTEMTERLTKRSSNLRMAIKNLSQSEDVFFLEWEMTIGYKKYPDSILYGATRLKVDDSGKIIEQRDYYDLWGDIFDNIPRFCGPYRRFMKKKFG